MAGFRVLKDVYDNQAIKHAIINATGSGDTQIVAGVSGKKILVLGYLFVSALAVAVQFKSNGGNLLSGNIAAGANQSVSYAGGIWAPAFETALDEGFKITLSLGVSVQGHVTYLEV